MAGNAHKSRPRARACTPDCKFCRTRPKLAKIHRLYRNSTGNRHNPAAGKKQKKGGR